jgi:tellurite resistance protein TehA-like permease
MRVPGPSAITAPITRDPDRADDVRMTPAAQPGRGRRPALSAPTWRWLDDGVRSLYPGYFALVMATGIVSNGFFFLGVHGVSGALLAVNVVAYPLLVAATVARAVRHPRALWCDLVDPRLVFSFFTIVAGTDVFGLQLSLRGLDGLAIALWVVALAVWVLLSYLSFSVLTFINTEKTGADVVHGGWLIAIVGTESLALLGARLAPHLGGLESLAFVTVHMLWGIGIVFYGIFITLFSYRIFFLRVRAADMNPLFWVIMGAAAIATNAGSTLIVTPTELPFLASMHAFIDGTTLILWAWATWWIPLLVIFGVWRHAVGREPLTYDPMYWSLVFPVGMYSVATYRLSLAADFPPLQTVAHVVVWVALATWLAAMLGLVRSRARSFAGRRA